MKDGHFKPAGPIATGSANDTNWQCQQDRRVMK